VYAHDNQPGLPAALEAAGPGTHLPGEEAERRGCEYVFVDALPTSEPILARCGFIAVT
jgi:hypothetical protein